MIWTPDHWTCSFCDTRYPSTFDTKEEYAQHLIDKHSETALAKRVLRERAGLEITKLAGKPKPRAAISRA